MAGEDLSVSTPTEVPPQTSTGPVGNGLSSQNAPIDALSAPRSPTENGPAAESRLSLKWTFTELGSALESDSLPEHTSAQSRPTATATDPSGSDDYDPGYIDNDALCATCRFLLEDHDPNLELEGWEVKLSEWGGESEGYRGYKCHLTTNMTWSSNLESILFGGKCPLCCELLCGISSTLDEFFQQHPTRDEITVVKSIEYEKPWQCFWVLLEVQLEHRGGLEYMRARVNLYPERETKIDPWYSWCKDGYKVQLLSNRALIGNSGPFESNTGSDRSWQLVSSWMAKCLSSHQTCNQMQSVAPPLPTRVIDVGSRGGSCVPCLHVVTENTSGHYATLSHRWGSQEMLKLEVNNLEDLKREIPWERLPKTFQDAIEATRRLGIRYIWIDSLCIIQDSPNGKDWAAESAKMTSVYENSYINIAAADAMNPTEGCFFDRNPSSVRPVRFHIEWPWAVEFEPGYYYAARSHRFGGNVAKAPLYRRGWVYQERTLAPRIIHCCAKQLYWECLESIASESFPMGLPHSIECLPHSIEVESPDGTYCHCSKWQKIIPPVSDINKYLDGSSPSSNEYFESLMLWNRVVVQYQKLDLTFERDKLVAISGLAKMHSRFLNTRYLAGMWLEHLPMQLLWVRDWWKDRGSRSCNEYIAPSWSWASIPNPVWLLVDDLQEIRDKCRPIIQILDATVDLVDENHPFGAVSGGALRIKGPLANSSLIQNFAFIEDPDKNKVITHNGSLAGGYSLDTAFFPSQLRCKKPTYLLPVMHMLDAHVGWGFAGFDKDYVGGLMLQETDRGKNIFQRVGVFELEDSSSETEEEDKTEEEGGRGLQMLQEACRSQNGPDGDGPFPEWGKLQTITII